MRPRSRSRGLRCRRPGHFFPIFAAVHALKGAGVKEPVEELGPADAERVLQIQTQAYSEAVDGNGTVATINRAT